MLLYLRSKGSAAIRRLASFINCNPLSEYEISEVGSINEILTEILGADRAIIWNELIRVCPELLEPEGSDLDCDDEEDVDDEEREERDDCEESEDDEDY